MSSEFSFNIPVIVATSSIINTSLDDFISNSTIVSGPPTPQKKQDENGPFERI